MKVKVLVFVLLVLLVIPLVAAPATTIVNLQAETPGLTILFPQIEIYPDNSNISFNFHIYNSTNFFLDNQVYGVNCSIHIYNQTGKGIVDEYMQLQDYGDFKYTTTKELLIPGKYSYLTQCNSSVIQEAGFVSFDFEVTASGQDETVKDTTGSLAITIFILLTTAALFALPFFVRFTKNEISNVILRRCCWVIGIYLMMLNSSMLATIAKQSNILLTDELFRYMWLFGTAGYVFMGFVVLKTIFDVLEIYNKQISDKRMGGEL